MVACGWLCRKLMRRVAAYLFSKVITCSTARCCLFASIAVWGMIVPWPHLPARGGWKGGGGVADTSPWLHHPHISYVAHVKPLFLRRLSVPQPPPPALSSVTNTSGTNKRRKKNTRHASRDVWHLQNKYLLSLNYFILLRLSQSEEPGTSWFSNEK